MVYRYYFCSLIIRYTSAEDQEYAVLKVVINTVIFTPWLENLRWD